MYAVVSLVVVALTAVHGQSVPSSLVDIAGLKVCTIADCIANDNIEKLQNYATELAQNLETNTNHNSPPSYDSFYQLITGVMQTEVMDTCDALGQQYVTDTINSLTDELTTIANYASQIYSSCADIFNNVDDAKDGYYKIQRSDGIVVNVYCLMATDKCTGGGWMRIGYFNTISTNNDDNQCPSPLTSVSYDGLNQTLCQRSHDGIGCDSFYYDSFGKSYSKVCGRAKGYMFGSPDSFTPGGIDDNYVDGISLTYGSNPRTHIWSFVGGVNTDGTSHVDCPCNNFNSDNPPSFVGNDYYCETGLPQGEGWSPPRFHPNDPLWDGEQCESLEGGCCNSPDLPYFTKDLGKTISDSVEIRVCDDEVETNERLPLELFELYVQ